MATKKIENTKRPIAEVRKENEELHAKIEKMENMAWCYMCDTQKNKETGFYKSTDPLIKSGCSPICKKCAYDLAMRKDKNGEYHEPTKESVQLALKYLNKPYYESVWNASINESSNENTGKTKNNVWTSYIKNIGMMQYNGYTWADSDMFKEHIIYEDEKNADNIIIGHEDQDTYTDYIKNKNDVKRLLGYDPFEQESISDQPFLYSQLLGLLDSSEDANDDMMRTASAISIVRGFLQQSKIDDAIAKLMSDAKQFTKNSGTIKSMQDSKKSLTSIIKDLAAESCISLKNSKNTKKGENTWTGKLKKIKDLNLRAGEINGFDLSTCKAMRQVMDQSNASILEQLHLDESEWSDMIADQREIITKLNNELQSFKEIARILLRENMDIRDSIDDHGFDLGLALVDLDELFSPFMVDEGEESEESEPFDELIELQKNEDVTNEE